MAFSVKDWRNFPEVTTPLSAAALENLETRVTDYTDLLIGTDAGIYNVMDYGATGDGVADDTAEIQAAITAAFNAPGGEVVIPPGEYLISASLAIPANTAGAIKIRGVGGLKANTGTTSGDADVPLGATLVYSGNTGDVIYAETTAAVRQNIQIENLTIVGNSAGASGCGIHLEGKAAVASLSPKIRDVTVLDCKDHGIWLEGNVMEGYILGYRAHSCAGYALKCSVGDGGGIPVENVLVGGQFWSCGGGISVTGAADLTVTQAAIGLSDGYAIFIEGSQFWAVGLRLEENQQGDTGPHIQLTSHNRIQGLNISVPTNQLGTAITYEANSYASHIGGCYINSGVADANFVDLKFPATTSRHVVDGFVTSDNDDTRISDLGFNAYHRGNEWIAKASARSYPGEFFIDSTGGTAKFKDGGGTIHALY